MPRLDTETKEQIKKLDYHVLQEIIIKRASKEKNVAFTQNDMRKPGKYCLSHLAIHSRITFQK